ncbi:MAG: chorismate mutase [Gemmatimonadetes bacterium]|nr:chorismate mutase [Gemmatimonadota bacterium]
MSAETCAARRLAMLRESVEAIDRRLIGLIAERVALAREIGREKKAAGLPTLDPSREVEIVSGAVREARDAGLDPETVRDIAWRIVGLSRRAQLDDRSPMTPVS